MALAIDASWESVGCAVASDRLEAPDGLAELVAFLGVGRAQVEHALGQADEQRGGPGGGAVRQQPHRGFGRHAVGEEGVRGQGPVHRGEIAQRTQRGRGVRGAGRGGHGVQLPPRVGVAHRQEQQARVAGTDHTGRAQGSVGGHHGRRHSAAGRDIDAANGEADVVPHQRGEGGRGGGVGEQRGERRRGEGRGLEQRLGQAGPARLFEHSHEVDVAQAQSVGGLGHHECRRAQLGEHGPAVLGLLEARRLVGQFEGTQRGRGALGVENHAHALAQRLLLVGEREIHDQPRGSPSRRSATTLR
jgi:hypothetical protein